ncbi:hypothetical protein FRC12_015531 [Ceratobasidium sp. 428]|nr:hypothetical protein FRC09_001019 [Ceratobasidium sp. 395]KAG8741839.1 hypothetical protein FRC12_015531 [Ceratobasidium sp. 428]
MSYQPVLTESDIEKMLISFELDERYGGLIHQLALRYQLQDALLDAGSLEHLSIPLNAVLYSDHSYCYAILSALPVRNSKARGLDIWRGGSKKGTMIGFCFLHFEHPTDRNTAQIGVALLPECQNKGYGRAAVHKLLAYAFDAHHVHRVFAEVVNVTAPTRPAKVRKEALFEAKRICHVFQKYGFHFEGVSRGAAMMEVEGAKVWGDMHRLSILDTDWFSMKMGSLSVEGSPSRFMVPSTPWEEMDQRHGAERKELLGWCEKPRLSNVVQEVDDDDDGTYYCSDGSDEGSDD